METPVNAGFGMATTAVLCSPLYFLLRRRLLAATIHSCFYLLAIATVIFGVGVLFWAVGAMHAMWDFAALQRERVIQRHATVIAERIAATQAR